MSLKAIHRNKYLCLVEERGTKNIVFLKSKSPKLTMILIPFPKGHKKVLPSYADKTELLMSMICCLKELTFLSLSPNQTVIMIINNFAFQRDKKLSLSHKHNRVVTINHSLSKGTQKVFPSHISLTDFLLSKIRFPKGQKLLSLSLNQRELLLSMIRFPKGQTFLSLSLNQTELL